MYNLYFAYFQKGWLVEGEGWVKNDPNSSSLSDEEKRVFLSESGRAGRRKYMWADNDVFSFGFVTLEVMKDIQIEESTRLL